MAAHVQRQSLPPNRIYLAITPVDKSAGGSVMSPTDDRDHTARSGGTPYPYLYGKDPGNARRTLMPGDRFAPAERRLPRRGLVLS